MLPDSLDSGQRPAGVVSALLAIRHPPALQTLRNYGRRVVGAPGYGTSSAPANPSGDPKGLPLAHKASLDSTPIAFATQKSQRMYRGSGSPPRDNGCTLVYWMVAITPTPRTRFV